MLHVVLKRAILLLKIQQEKEFFQGKNNCSCTVDLSIYVQLEPAEITFKKGINKTLDFSTKSEKQTGKECKDKVIISLPLKNGDVSLPLET